MGRDPFAADATRVLSVRFRHRSNGWSARITAHDTDREGDGVRELSRRAESCAALADAVGLAVALAIAPDAPLAPPPAPTPTCPPVVECPAPAVCPVTGCPRVEPRVVVREVPAPARGVASSLSLRGGVTAGATPFAPVVSLEFRSRHERPWHAAAGALLVPTTRADSATGFGLAAVYAGLCAGSLGAVRASGCAGLQLGALHAVVYELVPLAPGDRAWFGAFVEGALRVNLTGPLFAEGAARATLAIAHQRYTVRGREAPAFDPWPVALDATLGLGVDF